MDPSPRVVGSLGRSGAPPSPHGCSNGMTWKVWLGPSGVVVVPTSLLMVARYVPLATRCG